MHVALPRWVQARSCYRRKARMGTSRRNGVRQVWKVARHPGTSHFVFHQTFPFSPQLRAAAERCQVAHRDGNTRRQARGHHGGRRNAKRTKSMIVNTRQSLTALLALTFWASSTRADTGPPIASRPWPNNFVTRVELSLLLQTLNADLLSHDSATLTLERWCADHRLASVPRIVVERIPGPDKPATEQQRRELGVTPADPVRYRRVRLLCGNVVLSEADNWYVPARLAVEMNKLLDKTDIPFGRVVQALHFQRHTLSSTQLWFPLPEGWEMNSIPTSDASAVLTIPSELLQHRALLTLPDGIPFSEVVETYTGGVLAFPVPGP